jgi:MFS family permease
MQGNNVGLLAGPAVAGTIAATWGWPWVAAWVGALAVTALALVHALRRLSRPEPSGERQFNS